MITLYCYYRLLPPIQEGIYKLLYQFGVRQFKCARIWPIVLDLTGGWMRDRGRDLGTAWRGTWPMAACSGGRGGRDDVAFYGAINAGFSLAGLLDLC